MIIFSPTEKIVKKKIKKKSESQMSEALRLEFNQNYSPYDKISKLPHNSYKKKRLTTLSISKTKPKP